MNTKANKKIVKQVAYTVKLEMDGYVNSLMAE